MEEEYTIRVEINYNENKFDFSQKNRIKLSEIKKAIKDKFKIDNFSIHQIEENGNFKKEILNDDDFKISNMKKSAHDYLIKLKVIEIQNNLDMIYNKRIEELQKILLEEKKKEEKEDKDFEEKMKSIEENQLKEIESLKKEINEMKQKNKNNKVINISNFEINNDLIKFLQINLVEDLTNTIYNYINNYDKNMNEKINEIKEKLNRQANSLIDGQFNKILSEVKTNNDNILNECIKNQNDIIENINDIKNELNLKGNEKKIENISFNDSLNEINQNNEDLNNDNKIKDKYANNINNSTNENLKKENGKYSEKINKLKSGEGRYKNRKLNEININSKKEQLDGNNKINKNIEIQKENVDDSHNEPDININDSITNKQNNFNESNNIRPIERKVGENNNINILKSLNPKTEIPKKKPKKIYSSMNKVFFNDFQQKYIKFEKINDCELDQVKKEIEKEFNEGKFVLKNYCQSFIEENVLPFFKKNKLNNNQFETLKYNIEKILECCGLSIEIYKDDIYPQRIKQIKADRRQSIEALRKFRKEFGITEKEFSDEGIIKRLEENGLDINKTFQKIFG